MALLLCGALWRSFELGASRRSNHALPKLSAAQQTAWFAAKYALLQRTAGLVAAAKIGCKLPLAHTRPCSLQQALDQQPLALLRGQRHRVDTQGCRSAAPPASPCICSDKVPVSEQGSV